MKITGETKVKTASGEDHRWIVEVSDSEILDIVDMAPPNSFAIGEEYKLSRTIELARNIMTDQLEIRAKIELLSFAAEELWKSA